LPFHSRPRALRVSLEVTKFAWVLQSPRLKCKSTSGALVTVPSSAASPRRTRAERLTDKQVVRLVQRCALKAGLRGDLSEGERKRAFGGHSLRAGLASSAQIEEAHVQKHLGHASAEMTRRYQRKRDRFKVNLTKAAGL